MTTISPHLVPLPASPYLDSIRRGSTVSSGYIPSAPPSPLTTDGRPRFGRQSTSTTIRQTGPPDPFLEGSTISVNQPVGSLSISPSNRDVCLASRKGLYILDLANLNNAPRFIPQGGTWQIADCQWSPHPSTSNLILSTSSQKLLVWDLSAPKSLHSSIDAHARAITDINWHALNPNLMATTSMDAGIRGWDLRTGDKPFMRLAAWGQAGTQVKWNRQHEHLLATAHGKEVIIWDSRKGSVPLTSIRAHDAKIYGIDWDRGYRDKLVTCSLDKTIKFWTVPELRTTNTATMDFYDISAAPKGPTHTITTTYPVWRARNLPFGSGVLALPQRGEQALEMFGTDKNYTRPVERFQGHDDVVKEFVWRTRGGQNEGFEDREFQLVSWAKDRTLRIWPVTRDITEKFGYKYGQPIRVLLSRKGAADITYTKVPDAKDQTHLPPPMVNPSGISRQKLTKTADTGMTRGGGRVQAVDQLEWLKKVVRNRNSSRDSPDSSAMQSRSASAVRGVRTESLEGMSEKGEYISLEDEVVQVNREFPRPRLNFEKIDLHHRKLTMSMNGPWANGDRMAFLRIHWSFPAKYPYSQEVPTFELERNPTVSPIIRQKLVKTIKEMRAENRQCLLATSAFLMGLNERVGRRMIDEESDSESDTDDKLTNVPMLARTSGATFGPNGQLVCFFPKQTVLPRSKHTSRSPAGFPEQRSSLTRAMLALNRLENPRQRAPFRPKPRIRQLQSVPAAVQAGSTLTVHDVSHFDQPDYDLAKAYGVSTSVSDNLRTAYEAKRLGHAVVWATLQGLLSEPLPPYSAHPPHDLDASDERAARTSWQRNNARKQVVLQQLFDALVANRDVQLLALVSCCLLEYTRQHPEPTAPKIDVYRSPEQDYFALPVPQYSASSAGMTPTVPRQKRRSLTPASPGTATSAWSQILNPSSATLRTPGQRSSIDGVPPKTPLASSFEQHGVPGKYIPVPTLKGESPRRRERMRTGSGQASASPPFMTPLRSAGKSAGGRSSDELRPDSNPVTVSGGGSSHGSIKVLSAGSPLRQRGYVVKSEAGSDRPKRSKICAVKMELQSDVEGSPSLLSSDMRVQCEGFKLAYAEYLLRWDLLQVRAALLQFNFLDHLSGPTRAASAQSTRTKPSKIRLPSDNKPMEVCVACASQCTKCPACTRTPRHPTCSYCRLPIKGLSTLCGICKHRTHSTCFKQHFAKSTAATTTCPGCLCRCVAEGGVKSPSFTFQPAVTPSAATISRAFARPSINPLVGNASSRMTYASLKTIRENDTPGDASALGLSPEGDLPPKSAGGATESGGGWLGWESRLHWGLNRDDPPSIAAPKPESAHRTTSGGIGREASSGRPPSREGDDARGMLTPVQRSREGSVTEPGKEQTSGGSGYGSRMRLAAFRSGDLRRQPKG